MKISPRTYLKIPVLVLLGIVAFQSAAFAQDKARKIDELISRYQQYGQFNGSALVADNGKLIYQKGFGLANMEWNIPNTPDTKFPSPHNPDPLKCVVGRLGRQT